MGRARLQYIMKAAAFGVFVVLCSVHSANSNNKNPLSSHNTLGINKISSHTKVAQSIPSQPTSDWSELPGWQGLSSDDYDTFSSDTFDSRGLDTSSDAAKELYDRAYRQMLVGDLDTAEVQFKRLMLHYQSSPIAKKAEQQLSRIHNEKAQEGTKASPQKQATANITNAPIHQFSIVSRAHPFQPDLKDNPADKLDNPAKTGVATGTIDDFIMNIGDRIFFNKASDTLTPEARNLLKSQANWLKKNDRFELVIEGHANEDGSENYNYKLSESRAQKVRDFFLGQGIPIDRIRILSYGNAKPIALCEENSCLAQNRRVVTRLDPSYKR